MAKLTVSISDEALLKLTEAARLAGVTPERMAETRLEAWPRTDDDNPSPNHAPVGVSEPNHAWPRADDDRDPPEDNAANYDLNEPGRPWSEVRPEMEALLERKLSKTR